MRYASWISCYYELVRLWLNRLRYRVRGIFIFSYVYLKKYLILSSFSWSRGARRGVNLYQDLCRSSDVVILGIYVRVKLIIMYMPL